MDVTQMYIFISIVILLIAGVLIFFARGNKKKEKKLTPLTGIAFAFVLSGIIFGGNKLVGYSLMGIGVLIAVIDIIMKMKKK